MSAKEKMQVIATNISDKTKEYAPIVKEKLLRAYDTTKDFTINVIIPKIKAGADHLKEKIEDWQKKKANTTTSKTNTVNAAPIQTKTTTTSTVTSTQPKQTRPIQTEHKKHL